MAFDNYRETGVASQAKSSFPLRKTLGRWAGRMWADRGNPDGGIAASRSSKGNGFALPEIDAGPSLSELIKQANSDRLNLNNALPGLPRDELEPAQTVEEYRHWSSYERLKERDLKMVDKIAETQRKAFKEMEAEFIEHEGRHGQFSAGAAEKELLHPENAAIRGSVAPRTRNPEKMYHSADAHDAPDWIEYGGARLEQQLS